jgi:acylphosphatase
VKRVRCQIYGDVQGVAFRAFIRGHARRLQLDGYVRNLTDGSVELEAAGADEAVVALLSAAELGPPAARVTEVREQPATQDPLPRPFAITW